MSVQETSFVAGPRGNKKSAPKADIVGLTVALLLKPGFSLFINAFPGFNYIVLMLKSRIRVLKPRTKLRLKFVRVLSAVQRAESGKALHTSPLFETRSVRELCAGRPSFSGI